MFAWVCAGAIPDAAVLVQGAAAAARPGARRGSRHGVPRDRAVLAGPNWYMSSFTYFTPSTFYQEKNVLRAHVLVQLYTISVFFLFSVLV
jgi:hypothetical protein